MEKVIKVYLGTDIETAEIHTFADLHIGDPLCDLAHIKKRISDIAAKDNARIILNGDILNNAITTSVSDSYAEVLSPQQALDVAAELFMPVKNKIIAITNGNHEDRTYKQTGIDLTSVLALKLGKEKVYSPTAIVMIIRLGKSNRNRPQWYSFYITHGRGGGAKAGSKINRLTELESIIDTDIYIHSHTHLPAIIKQSYNRLDVINGVVQPVDKLFVNTSSELNYGGYGQVACFKPSSKDTPVIILNGRKKYMQAIL